MTRTSHRDEIRIEPQEGPQYEFLATPADICIYGGAAGGGKTFGLLIETLRHCQDPNFTAVLFRRTSPQIEQAGGLWDTAREVYLPMRARMLEGKRHIAKFPSGARVDFLHLQHDKDVHDHQGAQYSLICFDELTHFNAYQFWYMVSRLRSMSDVESYMRCTTNPDPDSFVRTLIEWWIGEDGTAIPERSGVLRWFVRDGETLVWADDPDELREMYPDDDPMSLTFIAAKLEDNPKLVEKNPRYASMIRKMGPVESSRLLGANWDARPEGGKYIQREWIQRWSPHLPPPMALYICSDYAVSEPTDEYQDPDFTEHGVFGVDPDDNVNVCDWWYGQTASDEWIERLIDMVVRHKPHCLFGEAGVIQKAIEPALKRRLRERGVNTRIEWLSTGTSRLRGVSSQQGFADPSKQAKAIRGRALQARASMGKFRFPPDDHAPWVRRVIDQIVGFPVGKDDAFDVCAHICQAIDQAHPAVITPPKPPKRRDYKLVRGGGGADSWKTV